MKTVSRILELKENLKAARINNKHIGLVPTMGALHSGHLSLIEAALKNNDYTVVTIFVNPTQFNDPKDLERYPRNLEADLDLLSKFPVDMVFAPSVEEMYPEKDLRIFDLAPLDTVMEGSHRPGHFNGVAQIVSKLFDAVLPDRAYFGLKDFQQLAIIRKMVLQLGMKIEVIGCPIVREDDGLAMSSRNQLLSPAERQAAPVINRTLQSATNLSPFRTPAQVIDYVTNTINSHPLLQVEYFEIVDSQSLIPINNWIDSDNKIGCIAVQIGKVRLIDNKYFN